eukprot:gnl/TRDRNA2_/TRDRNA2_55641_c0_seq1.p1 gnl/TRDRNA2_/TRDRNA2_55641_c0~~gnl/TRDRNA2_/TRDRNA2_55641_c0_seq1.p1  ORF type:complete len:162 (-),score=4.31 gnl/TRDRNA2_/TRDRNA2_55641_c0_seq1:12-497(-)
MPSRTNVSCPSASSFSQEVQGNDALMQNTSPSSVIIVVIVMCTAALLLLSGVICYCLRRRDNKRSPEVTREVVEADQIGTPGDTCTQLESYSKPDLEGAEITMKLIEQLLGAMCSMVVVLDTELCLCKPCPQLASLLLHLNSDNGLLRTANKNKHKGVRLN